MIGQVSPERLAHTQDEKRPVDVPQPWKALGRQEVAKTACKFSQYFGEMACRNSRYHCCFFPPTTPAPQLHLAKLFLGRISDDTISV
ncbi:uncharacterized protein VTP21DRAFT_10179 [Calcarisporiella thermophila]|uniref:uncharacterized protein n=1 Tax=Calcarisporiella thermophila TaxID=911321 RepID=UPI003743000D